jgi:uncharacterized membrane protein YuzA (DUF378 family)
MDLMKRFEPVWLALVILGGLTWGMVALFDWNLVTEVFGSGTAADVVYVLFGIGALMFVPRLLEDLHITGDHAHPRGA